MRTIVLGQTGISLARYLEAVGNIVLDAQQQECVQTILSTPQRSFFVTGKAGCGKTATMRVLAGDDPLAMTVDLFLQHKPWLDFGKQLQRQVPVATRTLQHAPRIILEEIGQWSAANLVMLDAAMRKVSRSDIPFGGTQIVANGDFAQLAPVGNDPVNTHELWHQLGLETIELKRQHRQTEDAEDFVLFLEQLRWSTTERRPLPPFASEMLDKYLLRRPRRGCDFLGVTLTKNVCRDRNWEQVHNSDGPRYVVADGRNFPNILPTTAAVPLVPGCRVQATCNVWEHHRPKILNGQFGRLVAVEAGEAPKEITISIGKVPKTYFLLDPKKKWTAKVRMDSDETEHDVAMIETKDPVVGDTGDIKWKKSKTFPFECAYWTRLHRLQGQSVDGRMHIDFSSAISFEPATIYVGLSRAKRLWDVSVSNLDSYTFEKIVQNGDSP